LSFWIRENPRGRAGQQMVGACCCITLMLVAYSKNATQMYHVCGKKQKKIGTTAILVENIKANSYNTEVKRLISTITLKPH